MKFSEKWLREWVDPDLTTEQLVAQLTMAGLEVESTSAAAPPLDKVVVAEVVSCKQHPDADKLSLCQVNDGSADQIQVICGASNVRAGLKVAFAQVGANLPGIKIKKAKIRGVESFGMLCSGKELELSEAADGILELADDASVGQSIIDYYQLDDTIIEVDLTPNRGDCLSIAGVAREVSALNSITLNSVTPSTIEVKHEQTFPVELQAPGACASYTGRVIKNIDVSATTPMWMQEKLRRSEVRPISPVVDVTNYVMLELGQPMHGFDLDKLNGGIRVRLAEDKEKITLLDQSVLECRADTLVIADHQHVVALAGIMGGLDSSVQDDTRNIFLEAAFFNPIEIAGKARSYNLHTDSSHRFERGVDPYLQVRAINRATELLLEIVGGEAGSVIEQKAAEFLPKLAAVPLRLSRIKRLLGISISAEEVEAMLVRLQMEVKSDEDGWLVTPPSYRFDINIEADLIEEIGRLVGYNNIEGTQEAAHAKMDSFSETILPINRLRDVLVDRGYYEAITYSFVSPELLQILDPNQPSLALTNPISSDMSVMRTRLLPGLIQALRHNLNRQQNKVRLFETGLCFVPDGEDLSQISHISAVVTGSAHSENWFSNNRNVDFFDIKGDLQAIMNLSDSSGYRFQVSENKILHPGQGADIVYNEEVIGIVGALHPAVLKQLNLNQSVFFFELKVAPLLTAELAEFSELSKFPSIRRDISLDMSIEVSSQQLIDSIYQLKNRIIRDVFVFDVYTGKELRNNRKSVALGLILQDFSRTLVDKDVENLVEKVLVELKEHYNAVLREN